MKYWIKRKYGYDYALYLKVKKIKSWKEGVEALKEFYNFALEKLKKEKGYVWIQRDKCPFCELGSENGICDNCIWKDYAKKYPEEFNLKDYDFKLAGKNFCAIWKPYKKGSYSCISKFSDGENVDKEIEFVNECLKRLDKMEKIIKEKGVQYEVLD